jgi:hypothetical protein
MKHVNLVEIDKIQANIKVLEDEIRKLKREVDEARAEAGKKLKPIYTYEALVKTSTQEKSWHNELPKGTEYIIFKATLQNKEDYSKFLECYGSCATPDETKSSVTYYRKYGIMFHCGGGHLLLEDEQPCSDVEWEELKAGMISVKFDRYAKER